MSEMTSLFHFFLYGFELYCDLFLYLFIHPFFNLHLCYAVLFCSILLCSILFCSILFCSILFYSILFYSILFYTSPRNTDQHHITSYYITSHHNLPQHFTQLCSTILSYHTFPLYYVIPYYTLPYPTLPHTPYTSLYLSSHSFHDLISQDVWMMDLLIPTMDSTQRIRKFLWREQKFLYTENSSGNLYGLSLFILCLLMMLLCTRLYLYFRLSLYFRYNFSTL